MTDDVTYESIQVVIECRKLVQEHPGEYPGIELALRKLDHARRMRAGIEPLIEGTVRKGGQNTAPQTPRPPPPKGQGRGDAS